MTSLLSQWDFRHLEVVGTKVSSSAELAEICSRIPQLKIETRNSISYRKESQTAEQRRPRSLTKRQSLLYAKPQKEKLVTVKVVLPKKKSQVIERNYLCSCEEENSVALNDEEDDTDEIEFTELMDTFDKFNKGIQKDSSKNARNIARAFHGRRILTSDETIKVLKFLDTNNYGLLESVLLTISQLCTSTLNVKQFLEKGLMDELINLMLMGSDDNIKKEAVLCLSKVVEKTEHADLWLDVMTTSGVEALFGLLTQSSPLQHAVLLAIKNLATHPKMAQLLLDYGLADIMQLTACKDAQGKYIGNPEIQGLITHTLTNLISHDSSTVETFLLKHDDVMENVVNLLQYSPCLQQQQSARLLATLAFYNQGLTSLVSHNATEHLLWAVTCSQCRHLREQASIALKNISANPNRTSTLSALSQVAAGKPQSTDKGSWNSDSSGTFCNENNAQRPSTSHLLKTASNGTMLDREASLLKPQQSISEMTSLLTLVFQSDALSRSGSERKFVTPNHLNGLRSARLKQSHNFSKQDKYLSSLRVLTNALVVMSNAILITGNIGDESGELSVEVRRLNQVALMIQHGGLKFLKELEFLSNKLLEVNPPSFHNIDPTTLPPKEITATLKNARTDLIFESTSKKKKESCKKYADFEFEPNELDFVKAALDLLCLFAESTAPEFDPCLEDMRVLESARSKEAKRHISFHTSAVLVKNALRITKGTGDRKLIRSRSARFVWIIYPRGGGSLIKVTGGACRKL